MTGRLQGVFLAVAAVLVFASVQTPAWAIWAPVALEVLVDESFVIVEGKVTKIEKAGFAIGNRNQDVATITVTSVLKSLPHLNKPKQIRLLQPAEGGIAVSTDLRSSLGQAGIWLLVKHPERDGYLVKHPFQFQASDQKEKLVELIAAREKLAGGKPVAGLQARAELIENAVAGGPTFYEIRFSLKNVSDKPIQLLSYAGTQPLVVDWTGPGGKKFESKHCEWLKRADLREMTAEDVVTLPPGAVCFVGPQSKHEGIYFQTPSERAGAGDNVVATGTHELTPGYVNREAAEDLGIQGIWQGRVAANKLTVTVP